MTIGELLKRYRLMKNLTQKEMAGDILTPSYYSKVEKNIHRISAEDLLLILKRHHISTTDFFHQLTQKNDLNKIYELLGQAFYKKSLAMIEDVRMEVKENLLFSEKEKQIAFATAAVYEAIILNPQAEQVPDDAKKIIQDHIFNMADWSREKLMLYANFIYLYDLPTNQMLISSILTKNPETFLKSEKDIFLVILVNFISSCIDYDEDELALYYLKTANRYPTDNENFFTKLVLKCLENILLFRETQDKQYYHQVKSLLKVLDILDMPAYGIDLLNFLEKNKLRNEK